MLSRLKTAIGITTVALGALALTFSPGHSAAQGGGPAYSAIPPAVSAADREPLLPEGTPLGSAFAYQGQLKSGGAFVNATCDFQFALFAALTLGAQVGTTQTVGNVAVANGLFNASIDFGQGAFKSEARFLGTQVRCPAGSGGYTALTPRKTLGAAPFALSSAAPWVTKIDSTINYTGGNVGIGTAAAAHRLGLVGGPGWTSNGWTGALEMGNGSAMGWQANANSQHFGIGQSTGGLYFFHTPSNPGTAESAATYDMMISDAGRVGVGTTAPTAKLHAVSNNGDIGVVGSSISGAGVAGKSYGWIGVYGQGCAGCTGVHGDSSSGDGVIGVSVSAAGVHGYSTSGYGAVSMATSGSPACAARRRRTSCRSTTHSTQRTRPCSKRWSSRRT